MAITPALVKELRERTGVGMMDCKKALVEADGDIDAAAEILRKAGQAKADKKSGRIAAEGRILVAEGNGRYVILEVNSETDFVANDENFLGFAEKVGQAVLEHQPADVAALMALTVDGATLEEARTALVAKIGENIGVRRFEVVESTGNVASYVHMNRIGVIVDLEGGDEALARDIAMQVAATSPQFVSIDDVPKDALDKEREILVAQAEQEGKPPEIVQKMVEGRLRKHFDDVTLLGQPFVKNPDQRVRDLLKGAGASVKGFVRYAVGEGIEKKKENFAEEVAALQ
ncbi:MAG: translation elongation factor Ts [Gammaproteobacteria bacterium]|nr:translation elongation factor Ts [Gammaproteobacteria bacterium]